MGKNTPNAGENRVIEDARSALEGILREGARKMLQIAIEAEVQAFIDGHKNVLTPSGHPSLVRNGYLPEREITTGLGGIPIRQPRVRDRGSGIKFTSKILPPFLRRAPSIENLIPVLYLKGISTNDMPEALEAILGKASGGLSPASIVRMKEGWQKEHGLWSRRDLSEKHYVYFWADGIYFNIRLDADRPCLLVLMGALADGRKELVAIEDGVRESKESWLQVLRDLKARGLQKAPRLAIGDGALGFWQALREEFPETIEQRCWVHKTGNILDKLPKRVQPYAKKMIHEMYLAPTKVDANKAYNRFLSEFKPKYPKAVECLKKDHEVLFTFYDFPAEHWAHLRTSNPIESTFATVRHRTRQTKGCGSRGATLGMVFKLALEAARGWRRLNGHHLITKVVAGEVFVDGVLKEAA